MAVSYVQDTMDMEVVLLVYRLYDVLVDLDVERIGVSSEL